MLEKIKSPSDLRKLSLKKVPLIAGEVRGKIGGRMEKEELTFGSFGFIFWKGCFSVYLEERELIIKAPFRKVVIPLQAIDKVVATRSVRRILGFSSIIKGVYLKIIHHHAKTPKNIYFATGKKDSWFKAFQEKSILVESTPK